MGFSLNTRLTHLLSSPMSRRTFLRRSLLVGSAAITGPVVLNGCNAFGDDDDSDQTTVWTPVFIDEFAGLSGSPWDTGKWNGAPRAVMGSGAAVDIQSNHGRLFAGESNYHIVSAFTARTFRFPLLIEGDFTLQDLGGNYGYRYYALYSVSKVNLSQGDDSAHSGTEIENGYRLQFRNDVEGSRVRLTRFDDHSATNLATYTQRPIMNGVKYRYRIEVTRHYGDWLHRIWIWVDDHLQPEKPVIDVMDSSYESGHLGLIAENRRGPAHSNEGIQLLMDQLVVSMGNVEAVTAPVIRSVKATSTSSLLITWDNGKIS